MTPTAAVNLLLSGGRTEMDRVTESLLNEFSSEHALDHLKEDKQFEHDGSAWGEISSEDAELLEHSWEDLRRLLALVTEQAEEIERLRMNCDLAESNHEEARKQIESLRSEANRAVEVVERKRDEWQAVVDRMKGAPYEPVSAESKVWAADEILAELGGAR